MSFRAVYILSNRSCLNTRTKPVVPETCPFQTLPSPARSVSSSSCVLPALTTVDDAHYTAPSMPERSRAEKGEK